MKAISAQTPAADSGVVLNNKPSGNISIRPQFPGGNVELRKFLAKNIKYPWTAREHMASGKTYIAFMVETDGSLTSVVTNKDDYGFAKEATRVINLSPKWKPGIINGKAEKIRYSFSLDYIFIKHDFVSVDINLPE